MGLSVAVWPGALRRILMVQAGVQLASRTMRSGERVLVSWANLSRTWKEARAVERALQRAAPSRDSCSLRSSLRDRWLGAAPAGGSLSSSPPSPCWRAGLPFHPALAHALRLLLHRLRPSAPRAVPAARLPGPAPPGVLDARAPCAQQPPWPAGPAAPPRRARSRSSRVLLHQLLVVLLRAAQAGLQELRRPSRSWRSCRARTFSNARGAPAPPG